MWRAHRDLRAVRVLPGNSSPGAGHRNCCALGLCLALGGRTRGNSSSDGLEQLDHGRHHCLGRPVGRDQTIASALAARGTAVSGVVRKHYRRRCSVSEASPEFSNRRAARGARLKGTIDAGRTRDKVPAFDPGAAPLGTDEESAGTLPVPDDDQTLGSSQAPTEQVADPRGNDRSAYRAQDRLIWPIIGVLVLVVAGAALAAWLH